MTIDMKGFLFVAERCAACEKLQTFQPNLSFTCQNIIYILIYLLINVINYVIFYELFLYY